MGTLLLKSNGQALTAIDFIKEKTVVENSEQNDAVFAQVKSQLQQYFDGTLQKFTIQLFLVGTPFQRKVWRALAQIPYGTVISYKELAQRIVNPRAVRAVGGANGKNPIPIIIPCHRVIAADGSLGGYSSGLDVKKRLLSLEKVFELHGRYI